jgi:5-formyltetrahydrofolate cyclo-ligase
MSGGSRVTGRLERVNRSGAVRVRTEMAMQIGRSGQVHAHGPRGYFRSAMRHDRDAGGSAAVLAAKARVREEVWLAMSVKGIARFPSPDGRIPNFVGAEAAAAALASTDEWARARTVKANPDAPQLPVRVRALRDGKLLYMAVPRLAADDPFFVLDPDTLADPPHKAATIKGAARSARTIGFDAMEPVDLVVAGCVAVGVDGARLGKGGGFSDLEFALASAAGLIGPSTIVATTVHDVQVREAGGIPTVAHDVGVDVIATPTRVLRTKRRRRRPTLRWSELTDEKIAAIPPLTPLHARL